MAKLSYDESISSPGLKSLAQNDLDIPLHVLVQTVVLDFEEQLEAFFNQWGLTTSRFEILNMLYHNDQGITPTEAAKKVGVTNATISATLSGLRQLGFIQTLQNLGDSRSYRVQLSPEGRELLQRLYPLYHENIQKVWSHFDTQEKAQLKNLLTRFSQVLGVLGSRF